MGILFCYGNAKQGCDDGGRGDGENFMLKAESEGYDIVV